MPHARVGSEPVEHRGARQRSVHHDQMGHLVPVCLSVRVGDHQPDVVADHRDRLDDSQVVAYQRPDVARHRALVVAACRAPGLTGAPVVGSDDAIAGLDEKRDDVVPLPPRLREAVQEHDRARPVACRDVV